MANGKIPNINNKLYGEKLVEVTFPDSTSSLGFDEYNAVLNNVNSSVSSSIIMNADYALNARIPTNNDRLLSGTAQRMEIQDSNYSSVAWTSPRYVGSQTISATYNDYQPPGTASFVDGTTGNWKGDQVFDEYPGDETFTRGNPLGKVPAVDLYSTHFVLFDKIEIDKGFNSGDLFHCLYLIDDQGNKVPLTYKNKNIVDLQRLFIIGSSAEVVFLGQNDQEVLDEYPIRDVANITADSATFTNDIFKSDVDAPNNTTYQPNFSNDIISSNAFLRHTFINDTQTDFGIRLTPSAFNIENISLSQYRLTYANIDIRNSILSNTSGNSFTIKKSYIRQREGTNYIFFDGSCSIDCRIQDHDSKFDPFYFLTYNPKTSKIFENTLLEQEVQWNLATPPPDKLFPSYISPSDYPNYNQLSPIGSVSEYLPNYRPIQIGDILSFGKHPLIPPIPISDIGIVGSQPNEEIINNFREYYNETSNAEFKVKDINYPFSQSIEIISNRDHVRYETFNETGGLVSSTIIDDGTWQMPHSASIFPGISENLTPNFTQISTIQSSSFAGTYKGNFNIICTPNGYENNLFSIIQTCTPESVHSMIINKKSLDNVDKSQFLNSLSHNDIIEFAFNLNTPDVDLGAIAGVSYLPSIRYKIISKPFHPTVNSNVFTDAYVVRLQFIPTDNSSIFVNLDDPSNIHPYMAGSHMQISKIVKFRAPYIDVETIRTSDTVVSASINSSGSVMSLITKNFNEQYIESQNLEGTGVGVLIPDQYDPKLREQLPDIINKTGIDINSLVQGSN